jgi:predicted ATP-grasp superfamily ATP-dependent carboligase
LPEARTQQYVGTTWLDVRRDVQAAVVGIRRGELTAREWLTSLRGPRTHAIWSARDPRPFVTDLTNVARTAARRGR